jgi:hypothetical protein
MELGPASPTGINAHVLVTALLLTKPPGNGIRVFGLDLIRFLFQFCCRRLVFHRLVLFGFFLGWHSLNYPFDPGPPRSCTNKCSKIPQLVSWW